MPVDSKATPLPFAEQTGPRYWRSLEEYLDTPEFREMLYREFPDQASEWTNPVTRRRFLMLMGASLALMGLNGCSTQPAPREKIMPYVRQPEAIVPGKPLYFATAMPLAGVATGVLVESHEGRPTKIEGNPSHPASLGATDLLIQASILGLYDPDRSQAVTYRGRPRAWNETLSAIRSALDKLKTRQGAGLYILTENVTSPTLAAQLNELLDKDHFPKAKWFQYEPAGRSTVLEGAKQAFGEYVNTNYDFKKADVVLSLDADFLLAGPGTLRYTHDYSERRRVRTKDQKPADVKMNRLYVVECSLTNTGGVADHRLALRPSQIEPFAQALAAELGVTDAPKPLGKLTDEARRWMQPLAKDLKAHAGKCIVLAGDGQPSEVHALVHAINHMLKNVGETVLYTEPIEAKPADHGRQIAELVEEMAGRRVEMLVILGGNPVYTAPADLEFGEHLKKKGPLRIHLGLYQDETAVRCDWHIPEAHYLESWGDARAYEGTVSVIQPLIAPLFGGRSAHELLAAFTESPERGGLEIVREHWRQWWKEQGASGDFEMFWQRSLQEGIIAGTSYTHRTRELRKDWAKLARSAHEGGKFEIVFRPDPTLFDGRFANNGWLQELPKPVTKLTWDNAAILSPKTAEKLGVSYLKGSSAATSSTGGEHGHALVDVIELTYAGRKVKTPVWIQPGHADDAITIHLGHGRQHAGHVAQGVGFNAYALRIKDAPWFDGGLEMRKLPDEKHALACTQMHHNMEERAPVRAASLAHFKEHPHFARESRGEQHKHEEPDKRLTPLTLYTEGDKEFPYNGYKWAMAIDLTTCTGCTACVVACQSENNIPVVGKEEVTRGREMHWLRIDRYYEGDPFDANRVSAHFQPVPCMHCEKAPCELVCPVGATVHSHDGLNDMVYNRCVGTRYCSNNCPYKVRRFNFLQFADFTTGSLKLMRNPEVTVRSRGVMEKCSYCVQRIRAADIDAEREGRRITDRDLMTACQAACPAQAIVFGDLNQDSTVKAWKEEPLNYALLEELNTQPRTTYLAALRNPNLELEKKS
jgi:molybdopterin-containing oxidoreductase family iron-sulfur binding subunit